MNEQEFKELVNQSLSMDKEKAINILISIMLNDTEDYEKRLALSKAITVLQMLG